MSIYIGSAFSMDSTSRCQAHNTEFQELLKRVGKMRAAGGSFQNWRMGKSTAKLGCLILKK